MVARRPQAAYSSGLAPSQVAARFVCFTSSVMTISSTLIILTLIAINLIIIIITLATPRQARALAPGQVRHPKVPKNKDDAYADFMKEMQELL